MRVLLAAALLTGTALPAVAQPYGAPPYASGYAAQGYARQPSAQAQVAVSIAPGFAQKSRRIGIGERDLQELGDDLQRTVVRSLSRAGPGAPVRADLVIEDAVPNRPTFEQYSRTIGLSAQSFGLGGASVSGTVSFADGRTEPVSYRWYETDLRETFANATWTDAERAFDHFARNLQRGDLRARGYGEASRDAGAFGSRFGDGGR